MKNEYRHNDDGTTTIFLNRKDGSKLESLISTSDFEKVNNYYNGYYIGCWNIHSKQFRVQGVSRSNGTQKSFYLHRLIMDFPEGIIDHINHDMLDNRRENLRITDKSGNALNLKGSHADSGTGVRNVRFRKDTKKFDVSIHIKGKTHRLGCYETLEEAEKVAVEGRKRLLGGFLNG